MLKYSFTASFALQLLKTTSIPFHTYWLEVIKGIPQILRMFGTSVKSSVPGQLHKAQMLLCKIVSLCY